MDSNKPKLLFVGNFSRDIIQRHLNDGSVVTTYAMGGSVAYGPLAAATFGSRPSILCHLGSDVPQEFLETLKAQAIDLKPIVPNAEDGGDSVNTSYKLIYNTQNERTLELEQKGGIISHHSALSTGIVEGETIPDAVLFVPIAGELDENLVVDVTNLIHQKQKNVGKGPFVGIDLQGFVREFHGKTVGVHSANVMRQKLKKLATVVHIIKADYDEAAFIVASEAKDGVGKLPSIEECARRLHSDYGFPLACVTVGPGGCFVCSKATGVRFEPAYEPKEDINQTGCGDTFLACTTLELLHEAKLPDGSLALTSEKVLKAVRVGSAAASFVVEKPPLAGFATRDQILHRCATSKRIPPLPKYAPSAASDPLTQ